MMQAMSPSRQEVMIFLEKEVETKGSKYLSPAEENWQPGDLLPQTHEPDFGESLRNLQEQGGGSSTNYELADIKLR